MNLYLLEVQGLIGNHWNVERYVLFNVIKSGLSNLCVNYLEFFNINYTRRIIQFSCELLKLQLNYLENFILILYFILFTHKGGTLPPCGLCVGVNG